MSKKTLITRWGPTPTIDEHLTTKKYVDDLIAGISSPVQILVKQADQTKISDSTLADDDELFLPLLANTTYSMLFFLQVSSGSTPDLKMKWTLPAGATGVKNDSQDWNPTTASDTLNITTQKTPATGGAVQTFPINATIVVGGTAGNITFQWAQNVSTASNTIVYAGTTMLIFKSS